MLQLTQVDPSRLSPAAFLAAVLLLTGCDRQEDVQVYQVAKTPAATPSAGALGTGAGPADDGTLRWTLPADWFPKGGDAMRVGSFGVTNSTGQMADISVIPLGGMAGGELSNVNRWRGQVGLPPVQESELAALWEAVPIGPETGKLMDMAGTNPAEEAKSHILAAVLTRGPTTWFFKMTGGHDVVAAQKANFVAFLKSVAFGGGQAAGGPGAMPAGPLPDGHPPIEGAGLPPAAALPAGHPPLDGTGSTPAPAPAPAAAVAGSAGDPAGWVRQSPKPMQSERFTIKGEGGEAEATLSELGGEGGGALANVNRWRQQIGLAAITQDELSKLVASVAVKDVQATVVDMANEASKKRVVAAIVPKKGGSTLFYKLLGDGAVVGREKEKFIQYVRAAQ